MANGTANPSGEDDEDGDGAGGQAMECGALAGAPNISAEVADVAARVASGSATYAAVLKKRKGSAADDFVLGCKRSSSQVKADILEVNLFEDALVNLCKSRCSLAGEERFHEALVQLNVLASWLEEAMRTGLCIFFMSRAVTGLQVRSWVRAVSGGEDPAQIIFLGKSTFYVKCQDYKQKFALLSRGAAWGGSLFGIPLPWEESFDPVAQFAARCPVWVLVKNIPIFMLPHLEEILAPLGKVLYIPKMGAYVHSRSAKVCILWDLTKEIPSYLRVPVKDKDAIFIQLAFDPFPLACFLCNGFGHYARVCPQKISSSLDDAMAANDVGTQDTLSMQTDSVQQDGFTETDNSSEREDNQVSREATQFANAIAAVMESNLYGALASDCPMAGPSEEVAVPNPEFKMTFSAQPIPVTKSQKNKKKKAKKKKKVEEKTKVKELTTGEQNCFKPENESNAATSEDSRFAGISKNETTTRDVMMGIMSLGNAGKDKLVKASLLDERAREQLARVHVELHQYYDPATHYFNLPAVVVTKSDGSRYFSFRDGRQIEEQFFLDQFNIEPDDIRVIRMDPLP